MKKILHLIRNVPLHWVGDGFPVRTLFSHQSLGPAISPFLMLDYAAPHEFPPADQPRGVAEHPHRGFETVTIVYQGALEHRDSAGNHGKLAPGDVQWMTAASGVVHEEFHSREFTRNGGTLEMAQLWVNLPARHKMDPPRYQEIPARDIPVVPLEHEAGTARLIAGAFQSAVGTAQTFTPMLIADLHCSAARRTELPLPDGYNTVLLVRRGAVRLNDTQQAAALDLAVLDADGDRIAVECTQDADVLLLAGEPIGEPVVAHGPFVMNTREEIQQAVLDYQTGRMGALA